MNSATKEENTKKLIISCFIMFFIGLLGTLTANIVKTFFVKGIGIVSLPYAYIGISICSMLCFIYFLNYIDKVKKSRFFFWFSFVHLFFLTVAWLLMHNRVELTGQYSTILGISLGFILIANSLYYTIQAASWSIVGDFFRPAQARRYYPNFSIVRRFGSIICGLTVLLFVRYFDVINLLLINIFSTLILMVIAYIFPKYVEEKVERRVIISEENPPSFAELKKFLPGSKTVIALIIIAAIAVTSTTFVDFLYTQVMNLSFKEPSQLSAFFGYYSFFFNIYFIALQLFVGEKILLTVGVFRSLFILPILGMAFFSWLTFDFSFWPGLAMNFCWDTVTLLVQSNAMQLSMNVAPRRIRGRIRGLIDGIGASTGQLIGGVFIVVLQIALASLGLFQYTVISAVALLLSVVWLLIVAYGRRYYIKDLVRNLYGEGRATLFDALESMEERKEPLANQTLINLLIDEKHNTDNEVKAKVMEVLSKLGNMQSLRALALYLKDSEGYLRLAAAKALNNFKTLPNYDFARYYFNTQMISLFRKDPLGLVRVEAGKFLINNMPKKELPNYISQLLHDSDKYARISVIESVGKLDVPLVDLMQFELLEDNDPWIRSEAAVHLNKFEDYREKVKEVLQKLLSSDDIEHVRLGLISLIRLGGDRKFLTRVEPHLKSNISKIKCLAALYYLVGMKENDPRRDEMIQNIVDSLADPAYTEIEREDFIRFLTLLPDDILDDLLFTASQLDESKKKNIKKGLQKIGEILYHQLEI